MTNSGGAKNDGTVFALTFPTPEPSTLVLLAAACHWSSRLRLAAMPSQNSEALGL